MWDEIPYSITRSISKYVILQDWLALLLTCKRWNKLFGKFLNKERYETKKYVKNIFIKTFDGKIITYYVDIRLTCFDLKLCHILNELCQNWTATEGCVNLIEWLNFIYDGHYMDNIKPIMFYIKDNDRIIITTGSIGYKCTPMTCQQIKISQINERIKKSSVKKINYPSPMNIWTPPKNKALY